MKNKNQVVNFILQSTRISSHPKLSEILELIETFNNEEYFEVVYDVLQNGMILDSEYLIDILKTVMSAKEKTGAWALKQLMSEPKLLKDERFPQILNILRTASNYGIVFIGRLIVNENILLRENALDILDSVKDIYPRSSKAVKALLIKPSIEGRDLQIVKVITAYKSLTKLISIEERVTTLESGILENPEMKETAIKTIIHFKDHEESGTGLFSCLELFDEETDPTIERQLEQNKKRVLEMSHEDQIRVLQRERTMLKYTDAEIKRRQK